MRICRRICIYVRATPTCKIIEGPKTAFNGFQKRLSTVFKNGFQWFLVPVYFFKTVENKEASRQVRVSIDKFADEVSTFRKSIIYVLVFHAQKITHTY